MRYHPGLDVTPADPGLRPWRLPARSPGPLPGAGRQSPQRVNRKVGRASSQGNGPCSCSCSRKLLNCIENVSLGPRTCRLISHQGSGLGGREGGDWACGPPALLLPSAPAPGSPGWGWGRAAPALSSDQRTQKNYLAHCCLETAAGRPAGWSVRGTCINSQVGPGLGRRGAQRWCEAGPGQ